MDLQAMFSLPGPTVDSWRAILAALILSYVLTQAIAAVYAWTYRGLSYSRSMVQALVLAGIVSAMLMMAIGNSLARGIGIVGTLALIRFRTNLRDPLDMVFVFAAFGAGIASGTGSSATAVLGTLVFLVVVVALRFTGFGAQQQYDGVVRLRVPSSRSAQSEVETTLVNICRRFVLITLREAKQGEEIEVAYHISLKQPGDEVSLLSALTGIEGARSVTMSMQEATVEL